MLIAFHSLLHVDLDACACLLQELHEALLVLHSVVRLAPNLLPQVRLKLAHQALQGALGLLTDPSLQIDHFLNTVGLTLQPFCNL